MDVPGKKATELMLFSRTSICSAEDYEVYCQPCDHDGPRLPAHGYCTNCSEHLCETCFTFHKKHTLSRHHTLLDKANMPLTMSPPTPTEKLTNSCYKHKVEMIKFYCHNHKALLCSVCVTLEHTSCKVNYIPDISGQAVDGKEYQDVLKAIKDMTDDCDLLMQHVKEMKSKSNQSLTDAVENLVKFHKEVNQRLNEWNIHTKQAAQTIHDENSKNLDTKETMSDEIKKSLKTSLDLIEHLNTSKQVSNLFIELKRAEQKLEDLKPRLSELAEFNTQEYNFQPNEELSNLLEKEKSLGTLTGKSMKSTIFSESTNMNKICIKTAQESHDCWITGMAILAPDLLIITDEANKAVKMIKVKTKSVLDQLVLDCSPWDVTSISHDTAAVTLSDKQLIQMISVNENKLTKQHTLPVDGECLGISYQQDRLVVSFTNPAKIQILLIDGTVLQTIQEDRIFKYPSYVTTNDRYIFVSDPAMKKTVIKLDWQGEVVRKFHCTGKPRGSAISDDGKVFVSNVSNNTIGAIEDEMTTEFSVKNPQALCWCSQTRSLYISCLDELKENANYIKIISLA